MSEDPNLRTFEARDVVRFYAGSKDLQGAEEVIVEILSPRLAGMRMLDVGIGGGRTTRHLAGRVREYVGIDYAEAMVAACVADLGDRHRFEVCDMRDMRMFADASFDFVLASFNCIDYVPAEDRDKALGEMKRLVAPGGAFAFSTHNMGSVPELFSFQSSGGLVSAIEAAVKWARLRVANEPMANIIERESAVLNDGSYRFRARTHYVRPSAQIAELRRLGWAEVRVFSPRAGAEIAPDACDEARDPWLYFLCAA
jgi:SAM-dependent methyltransferase